MTLRVWRGITRALIFTCVLTFAALHDHALAQSPPGSGQGGSGAQITLTFDQAIARARVHAERVAAARVALDDGEARVALAGRRITSNPSVEAVFGGAANPSSVGTPASPGSPGSPGVPGVSGSTTAATEITVTQMFDIGARRTSRIGEAQAGIAADRARAGDMTRAWVRDAALLFVRALHAQARERLLASAEETAAAFLDVAERRYAAGDVAVLDVNVARAALAKARADRRGLAADQIDVTGQLRARLGMTAADGPIAIEGRLDLVTFSAATRADATAPSATTRETAPRETAPSSTAPGASAPAAVAAGSVATGTDANVPALGDHPALATFRGELAEAEAALAAARASAAPEFGATSKYMRDQGSNVWLGGVTLTLPIAARGRERRAIASARLSRARIALDLEQRALEQDVRTAMETHRLRVEAAQLLERDALPGLDENDTLARRSYEAGELSLTDSLAIRQQALDMRLAHADRLLDAATSGVLAQAAAGVLR